MCPCGNKFDIQHSKKVGFVTNRHNNIEDLTAKIIGSMHV